MDYHCSERVIWRQAFCMCVLYPPEADDTDLLSLFTHSLAVLGWSTIYLHALFTYDHFFTDAANAVVLKSVCANRPTSIRHIPSLVVVFNLR